MADYRLLYDPDSVLVVAIIEHVESSYDLLVLDQLVNCHNLFLKT
jgi:hypothetical protein